MDGAIIGSILGLGGMAVSGLVGWMISTEKKVATSERREIQGKLDALQQSMGHEMRQIRMEISNSIMAAEKSMFERMNGKYIPNMGAQLTGPEIERRLASHERKRQGHVET